MNRGQFEWGVLGLACRGLVVVLGLAAGEACAALTVAGGAASGVTRTSAWCNAEVTATNDNAAGVTGTVFYGRFNGATNPSWWASSTSVQVTALGAVTAQAAPLTPAAVYYSRWRLVQGGATNWDSGAQSFATVSGPVVTAPTTSVGSVTGSWAALYGGQPVLSTGIVVRLTNAPTAAGEMPQITDPALGLARWVAPTQLVAASVPWGELTGDLTAQADLWGWLAALTNAITNEVEARIEADATTNYVRRSGDTMSGGLTNQADFWLRVATWTNVSFAGAVNGDINGIYYEANAVLWTNALGWEMTNFGSWTLTSAGGAATYFALGSGSQVDGIWTGSETWAPGQTGTSTPAYVYGVVSVREMRGELDVLNAQTNYSLAAITPAGQATNGGVVLRVPQAPAYFVDGLSAQIGFERNDMGVIVTNWLFLFGGVPYVSADNTPKADAVPPEAQGHRRVVLTTDNPAIASGAPPGAGYSMRSTLAASSNLEWVVYVATNDATYTDTVAKAATAYGWGNHAGGGYLTAVDAANTYAPSGRVASIEEAGGANVTNVLNSWIGLTNAAARFAGVDVFLGTGRVYLGNDTNAPWLKGLGTTNIMFGAGTNWAIIGW